MIIMGLDPGSSGGISILETKTNNILNKDIDNPENYLKRIPLNRIGKPEEVAYAILFLSSAYSSYITGTTILVDGGFSIN